MEMSVGADFLLRKSTTSSLVLVGLRCRWLVACHSMKESTTPLYSSSFPSLTQPTIAESFANFCRWQESERNWKSEVSRVNRREGVVTMERGGLVRSFNTTSYCLAARWFVASDAPHATPHILPSCSAGVCAPDSSCSCLYPVGSSH